MRRRGFEALELPEVQDLGEDEDAFSLLGYGDMAQEELMLANPRRRVGPAAFGRAVNRPSMLDQPDSSNIGRSVDLIAMEAIVQPPPLPVIPWTVVSGLNQSILQVTGDDRECKQLSVSLMVEPIIGNPPRDATAIVRWGAGGLQSPDVEIDFINGTVFSVAASFLRIQGRIDTSFDGAGGRQGLKIGAFIGYGARPSSARAPQKTVKIAGVAAGGTADITIPTFARDLSILRLPSTFDFTVRFLNTVGSLLAEAGVPPGAELEARNIPIPNDASTVRITSGGMVCSSMRVIFGLAL